MFRASKNSKVSLLKNVSLFSACSKAELERIAALTDVASVDAGTQLTREGEPGEECFVVAEGEAEATLRGEKLAKFGPGAIFGEMALLDRSPRAATVVAITPMQLLVLEPRGFWRMVEESPTVARKIMVVLADRLRKAEQAPHY